MSKVYYEQAGVAMTCRGYEEYVRMFGLAETDLQRGAILDVAAGGSSFVASATNLGYEAYAVDPQYGKAAAEWIREAREEIAASTEKLGALQHKFDWSYYGSLAKHRAGREASLDLLERHLDEFGDEGASLYKAGSLPHLPFEDNLFGLVLCSHFLFLYAEQFGYEFHVQSVRELMRVCKPGGRIGIYPLLSLRWDTYPHLEQLIATIQAEGGAAELLKSGLPFIPGSEHYLSIQKL